MGLSVVDVCTPIPACIYDKTLISHVGNHSIKIPIPAVGRQEFPEQVNLYNDGDVFCYLRNDDYKVLMWYDGSGLIATNDNYIVKPFKFTNTLPHVSYKHCAHLRTKFEDYNLYLFQITNDDCVLSTIGYQFSCTLSLSNNQSLVDAMSVEYPILVYDNTKLRCIDTDGKFMFDVVGVVSHSTAVLSIC